MLIVGHLCKKSELEKKKTDLWTLCHPAVNRIVDWCRTTRTQVGLRRLHLNSNLEMKNKLLDLTRQL